jgi:Domain of unknown function (DUF4430)
VTAGRSPAAAVALLGAIAAAGCGLGPGPSVGDVDLTVTRDYGATKVLTQAESDAPESETAMRLLDRNADISTRYGGRFVQSIDGVAGDTKSGRRYDWFFYVNGVESPVGAAEYGLHGGDRVWWDYRDWTAAMRVPAVVGSFPEPFAHGYEGETHRVVVRCNGVEAACRAARERVGAVSAGEGQGPPIRVVIGTWGQLRDDSAAALIERGPAYSGVFADFVRRHGSWWLQALDAAGEPARPPSGAGLVAATRRGDDPPTWLVTGPDAGATLAAARALDSKDLRDRYAVAVDEGRAQPLPAR